MIRKITSLLIAGIVCGTLTAGADEIEFTYNTDGLIANVYGYNFKETSPTRNTSAAASRDSWWISPLKKMPSTI